MPREVHANDRSAPLRVMQSFRAPRTTTNPYITMLDAALEQSPGVEHVRFDWREALVGDYDVFHWHWPEGKLHGSTAWRSAGKCALTTALWLRLAASRRIVVARTVHNVELPDDTRARRWLLRRIERSAHVQIALNDQTPLAAPVRARIPHGHYREWYAPHPRAERIPGRVGTFGGVRRYKNGAGLVDAFADAVERRAGISLRVGGRPSTRALAAALAARAERVPAVTLDMRFLTDAELVRLATESTIVALPYRCMHNSGSVLAALSLDRPVLVPRNAVTDALATEVGEQWVQRFDGALTADAVLAALDAASAIPPSARPDLDARTWEGTAAAHARAYRAAARRPR